MFRARFFDQKGNKAAGEAEIALTCAGGSACDGLCTDLDLDGMNCGVCGHACASKVCQGGGCTPNLSGCFMKEDGFETCSLICQSFGEACAENQCPGGVTSRQFGLPNSCLNNSGGVQVKEPCDIIQD